jgi:hypothetical protein
MGKPTISAKDAIRDIRGGMDNAALMNKYGVSEAGLRSLMTKLVKAGLLDQSEVDARLAGGKPPLDETWKCPACGAAQPEKPDVCPQCGVIVSKLEKKLAEQGGQPDTSEPEDQEAPPRQEGARTKPRPDLVPCPHCSQPIHADATKCRHCGRWLEPSLESEGSDWDSKYCPWEDMENLGFFEAIKQTVLGVLFSPTRFFSQTPPSGGLAKPLVFGLILGSLGIVLTEVWTAVLQPAKAGPGHVLFWVILSPIVAAIALFVGSAITHVCLAIVGGAGEEYEATFRVQCYAQAAQVWQVLPVAGAFVSTIWTLVAAVVGLREVHGTTTGKAVLAVILPVLVCCGIGIVAAWLIGLAALTALMGRAH